MVIRICLSWACVLLFLVHAFGAGNNNDTTALCSCTSDDLSPSGIMISHLHPKGSWMFSYRYMHMYMQGNTAGNSPVSDNQVYASYLMAPNAMTMGMHMVMGMYGISDRFSMMAMLHFNVNEMSMNMLPGTPHIHNGVVTTMAHDMTMKTYGPGDTKIFGLYNLFERDAHSILAGLGLSLPTGRIDLKGDENSMYPNIRLPYLMQLGSGTWDFLPSLTYRYQKESFAWNTQFSGIVRPFYNSANYKYGHEINLTTWAAYQWLSWISTSARTEGSWVGKMDGVDNAIIQSYEPAGSPVNYGGQRVNGFVGVNFHLHFPNFPDSRLALEGGLPLYQNFNGIQMPTKFLINASWQIAF
ncbi:MAG: transporter [Cytophagales bacterium]|nr:transporter [Cytophagales bacterium]